jgi:nucleoside-diphosphate-sugar epimerase
MKILVTGAAGFIGHRVCELLLEGGDSVIGLDNLNDYYDTTMKEFRINKLKAFNQFQFFKIDIESAKDLMELFTMNSFRAVYHLAARAGVRSSLLNPLEYFNTNAIGTLNILELMHRHKVPKIIFSSTSSLYAGSTPPFSEELPVNTPLSPYAASKKSAEMLAYTYYSQYSIDVSVLRYFTVYGPLGRPDMAPFRFVKNILEQKPITVYGNGEQSRDFTYIDDIAQGTILAERMLGFEIINLGAGKIPLSINKFISYIENITKLKAIVHYVEKSSADMETTQADCKKAKRILGWEAKVTPLEGIDNMLRHPEYFKFSV